MDKGRYPWWVKRDLDGFFGLFLDNLIQLMLIVTLCAGILKFPESILGTILPGAAISIPVALTKLLLQSKLFYSNVILHR